MIDLFSSLWRKLNGQQEKHYQKLLLEREQAVAERDAAIGKLKAKVRALRASLSTNAPNERLVNRTDWTGAGGANQRQAQAPAEPQLSEIEALLTEEERARFSAAWAAVEKSPTMRAVTRRFNEARRAHQQNRQKFPADRDKTGAKKFQEAVRERDRAKREAILAVDPSLEPILETAKGRMNEGEIIADSASPKNPAIRQVEEVPGLPRVLIIGDSISIGYTLLVRKLLESKANVQRIPVNGRTVEYGLENLTEWLGDKKWDVIHFNFGINDAKHTSPTEVRIPRAKYADYLRQIVARMKETGARLTFATTTPIPNNGFISPTRMFDSIAERNEIARQIMVENGVEIVDLYSLALPHLSEIGRANDVHFKPQGYELFAKSVAAAIESQLIVKRGCA